MSVNGSRERKCRKFPIGFGSIKNGNGNGSGSFRKSYSVSPSDYKLLEEVGYGATATVHRAVYIPSNEIVAVKCLDLERCNSNLDDIRREAQTMSLIDHPNVISAYCSFVVEHYLWVIMPFMAEGSCLHLMQIAYPDGFEESVIGSILKETLKALVYLHGHGHIHRDVKAGNVLLDSTGVVKLSDFGVSACMFDKGDRKHARNTFVGTPCWMAPEVLRPESGYDFKADIWSFGITALELAHGHAPFSKYPPMKVLLMTLQNAPPGLDYDRDKRFSKSFKEMVAMCLVKDQTKRPTAEKLLKHSFFKHTNLPELSVKSLLANLPPLWDRVQALQLKDAAQLALKKLPSSEQEAISQSEYQRGVSAWNFDIEDLKAQASLIQDDDDLSEIKEDDGSRKLFANVKDPSIPSSGQGISSVSNEINCREKRCSTEGSGASLSSNKDVLLETSSLGSRNQEALDENVKSQSKIGLTAISSTSNQSIEANKWKLRTGKKQQTYSGPLIASSFHSSSFLEKGNNSYRSEGENHLAIDKNKQNAAKVPVSDILMLPTRASANSLSAPMQSSGGYGDSLEDKSKSNSVEIKGRFSVTSEKLDLVKDVPLCTIPRRSSQQTNQYPKETANDSVPASILMPHLQNLLQQTTFQQDLIINLLNSLQRNKLDDTLQNGISSQTQPAEDDILAGTTITERERVLLMKIAELQARMVSLTHELTAEKLKVNKLQEYLNAVYRQEEMEDSLDAAINGS